MRGRPVGNGRVSCSLTASMVRGASERTGRGARQRVIDAGVGTHAARRCGRVTSSPSRSRRYDGDRAPADEQAPFPWRTGPRARPASSGDRAATHRRAASRSPRQQHLQLGNRAVRRRLRRRLPGRRHEPRDELAHRAERVGHRVGDRPGANRFVAADERVPEIQLRHVLPARQRVPPVQPERRPLPAAHRWPLRDAEPVER